MNLLKKLFQTPAVKQEIDEELRFHIEQRTAESISAGMMPEEAAREARKRFGNFQSFREECREARGANFGETALRDIRFAVRQLRKNPGFTAVAVLTLALCIGANLSIFTVVDAILIRSLAFPEANRLVTIYNSYPKADVDQDGASLTSYYERRGRTPDLPQMSAFRYNSGIIGESGSTERRDIMRVWPEFFRTLGIGLALGRAITDDEMTLQTDGAAILTDGCWRQRFNGDPGVLGRSIRIDGLSKTIVGVLPPDFCFLSSKAQIFLPLSSSAEERALNARHVSGTETIARLKPGAALIEAQAEIDADNAAHAAEYPWAKQVAEAGFHTPTTPSSL